MRDVIPRRIHQEAKGCVGNGIVVEFICAPGDDVILPFGGFDLFQVCR
jgi:hypothetical protein